MNAYEAIKEINVLTDRVKALTDAIDKLNEGKVINPDARITIHILVEMRKEIDAKRDILADKLRSINIF